MRKFGFFVAMSLLLTTAVTASGNAPQGDGQKIKAEQALESLRRAYIDRSADSFMQNVDEMSHLKAADLRSTLTSHFTAFSQIDWNLVTDHAVSENEKVSIRTHWQKRMVRNRTGQVEKSEGQTEFIFQVTEDAKLIDFFGDNPF